MILADAMRTIMMLPKAWRDPASETLSTFVLTSVVGLCALVAVGSLKPSLVIYPVYYIVANAIIAFVLIYRHPIVDVLDEIGASEELA